MSDSRNCKRPIQVKSFRVRKLNTPGADVIIVSRVMHKFVCRLRAPSQILPHHTADGFGGLDLHGVGGVGEGVGAQSEAGVCVSRHAGDGADVYPALQRRGCEGVSQIVEANGFQPQRFQNLFVGLSFNCKLSFRHITGGAINHDFSRN